MIYESSLAEMRRDITRSDLRFNLLRIYARAPRMIHHLIHAPHYPGIANTLFSLQSEINVTIEIGECRNRGLLTVVDRVQDPWNAKMQINLSRTTILPFLLAPELAYAEPQAYETYLRAWFAIPAIMGDLDKRADLMYALFLAFPELVPRAIYAAAPRDELPSESLDATGARQLFGWYQVRDLPTAPTYPHLSHLIATVRRPPLPAGWLILRNEKQVHRLLHGMARFVYAHKLRRPAPPPSVKVEVREISGPELLAGRVRPTLFAELKSVVHQ